MEKKERRKALIEVAAVFFRLGCLGFGGPAVHIAMMEEEVVRKRKWLRPEEFLDLVGAVNLIPGPNSTELTMHCGKERAGWPGLFVAGFCFIFPAVIITGLFAWAYKEYGELPHVQPFIYGIKPAILAVVVFLMISLAKKAVKSARLAFFGIAAVLLALAGFSEVHILFGIGFLAAFFQLAGKKQFFGLVPLMLLQAQTLPAKASATQLFWLFLKVGSILYGSGYVLFAFLDAELVSRGLLSKQQLVDAIAVGQFTPGPVFSSATFVGWQIAGISGAVLATIGIFLPSFIFVGCLNPIIPKLRKSPLMSAFLDAVNVVAVALILVVSVDLAKASITDWRTTLIALAGFAAAFYFKHLNTAFIILGGAVLGYCLTYL
ncbi:chromate efflux transporter [Pedobacter sp. SYSU D00535]|uniref:chromate efflux transporter n=1 Tax=Pedobacter sp. SYSU D00535 TaxID=2810308 RepID=UPI001A95CA13|nr:chromate efflux transporter [Pedobacter sp. SYSU D00535]